MNVLPNYGILCKTKLPESIIMYILKNFLYPEKKYIECISEIYKKLRKHYNKESMFLYNTIREYVKQDFYIYNYKQFKEHFIDFKSVTCNIHVYNNNYLIDTGIKIDSTRTLITEIEYINTINKSNIFQNQLEYFEIYDNINLHINNILKNNNINEKIISDMNMKDKIEMIIKL